MRIYEDRSTLVLAAALYSIQNTFKCIWSYHYIQERFNFAGQLFVEENLAVSGIWANNSKVWPKRCNVIQFFYFCVTLHLVGHTLEYIYDARNPKRQKKNEPINLFPDYDVRRRTQISSGKCKGKSVPLQAWSGPEVSRKLSFPDFMTKAQEGDKIVSLTHRPPLPPINLPGTHFC